MGFAMCYAHPATPHAGATAVARNSIQLDWRAGPGGIVVDGSF